MTRKTGARRKISHAAPLTSATALLLASPDEPLPAAELEKLVLGLYSTLHVIAHGQQPKAADWRELADVINHMDTLLEAGAVQDTSGLLRVATLAMADAALRGIKGKAIRLDGPGIQAMRAVLEDYTQIISQLSHRDLLGLYQRTHRRIQAARKRRPGEPFFVEV